MLFRTLWCVFYFNFVSHPKKYNFHQALLPSKGLLEFLREYGTMMILKTMKVLLGPLCYGSVLNLKSNLIKRRRIIFKYWKQTCLKNERWYLENMKISSQKHCVLRPKSLVRVTNDTCPETKAEKENEDEVLIPSSSKGPDTDQEFIDPESIIDNDPHMCSDRRTTDGVNLKSKLAILVFGLWIHKRVQFWWNNFQPKKFIQ